MKVFPKRDGESALNMYGWALEALDNNEIKRLEFEGNVMIVTFEGDEE